MGATEGGPDGAAGSEWSWEDWIDKLELAAAGARLAPGDGPEGPFQIAQVVVGGFETGWALRLEGDSISLRRQWQDSDVVLRAASDVAEALATGELGVAEALSEGKVKVSGDVAGMIAALPLLSRAQEALGQAMTEAGR